jgi:hypothetical protein
MGSIIELNDTLQITKKQGFPAQLTIEHHLKTPFTVDDFLGRVYSFSDKPEIRVFHMPPVRVFLVENINGKWIYWGLVHILEITHNYISKTTSGRYKIIKIYNPEEMKTAYETIDGRAGKDYFKD